MNYFKLFLGIKWKTWEAGASGTTRTKGKCTEKKKTQFYTQSYNMVGCFQTLLFKINNICLLLTGSEWSTWFSWGCWGTGLHREIHVFFVISSPLPKSNLFLIQSFSCYVYFAGLSRNIRRQGSARAKGESQS